MSEKNKKQYKDHVRHNNDTSELTWEKFKNLVETLYGEADPDRSGMRALLAVRQSGRPVSDYVSDFQRAVANISPAGTPTKNNQIFWSSWMSLNPVDFRPWAVLVSLIQAARNLGSVTKYGHQSSQSQATRTGNSGQKRITVC